MNDIEIARSVAEACGWKHCTRCGEYCWTLEDFSPMYDMNHAILAAEAAFFAFSLGTMRDGVRENWCRGTYLPHPASSELKSVEAVGETLSEAICEAILRLSEERGRQ